MKLIVGGMCFAEVEAETREEAINEFFQIVNHQSPLATFDVDTVQTEDGGEFYEEDFE